MKVDVTLAAWGMDLKIHCKDYGHSRDVVKVTIGASTVGTRCVQASQNVQCASYAANLGYRQNSDWATAADTWEITTNGRQVCARRTDHHAAWAMNLKIACQAA